MGGVGVTEREWRYGVDYLTGRVLRLVVLYLVISIGFAIVRDAFSSTYDDTDAGDGVRSGLDLRTDYGTCVQYLESGDGALTVRVDASGKPVLAKGCRP